MSQFHEIQVPGLEKSQNQHVVLPPISSLLSMIPMPTKRSQQPPALPHLSALLPDFLPAGEQFDLRQTPGSQNQHSSLHPSPASHLHSQFRQHRAQSYRSKTENFLVDHTHAHASHEPRAEAIHDHPHYHSGRGPSLCPPAIISVDRQQTTPPAIHTPHVEPAPSPQKRASPTTAHALSITVDAPIPLDHPHGKFKNFNPSWKNKRNEFGRFVSSKSPQQQAATASSKLSARKAKVSKKKNSQDPFDNPSWHNARDSSGRFVSAKSEQKSLQTSSSEDESSFSDIDPEDMEFSTHSSETLSSPSSTGPRRLTRAASRRLSEVTPTSTEGGFVDFPDTYTSPTDTQWHASVDRLDFVEIPKPVSDPLFSLAQIAALDN